MKRIRIMLVEDNRILREGITAIINAQPDMRVVAATGGNTIALRMAHEFNPHVLLVDLGLRNQTGLQVLRSVTEESAEVKVIGMGLVASQSDIVEFIEAGASGFIMKDATKRDFLASIRSVSKGIKIIPPQLTDSLFSLVIDHASKNGAQPANGARLTKRERDVIALISEGLSNKQIAQALNVATDTVKSHVHNILEKLALRSRLQISSVAHNDKFLK